MDKHHKVAICLKHNDVVVRTMSYVGISLDSNQLLDEKSFELRKLEKWVQFRTTDWMTELDYPEYTAKEVQRFLIGKFPTN